MTTADDDLTVTDARDEAVIAGRAVTADDVTLAQVLSGWRADAHAPAPSPELAAVLAGGLAMPTGAPAAADEAGIGLAEVVPLAPRRRRRARVVVAGALAAGLLITGGAAAAAVRDGVPLGEVPAAVGERLGAVVGDALVTLGLTERVAEPTPVPTDSGDVEAPGTEPVRSSEPGGDGADPEPEPEREREQVREQPAGPGRSDQAPSASPSPPDRDPESPGPPTEVPGQGPGSGNGSGSGPEAPSPSPGASGGAGPNG